MRLSQPPIVIGAGWSGLSCAVQLVRDGTTPIVLEAAPQAGGRARMVEVELDGKHYRLDNGQHLLLGAYTQTLELMHTVGVAPSSAFSQSSFAISYPDGWHLAAARLPAPWHLAVGIARARKIAWTHRWALAAWVQRQRRRNWSVPNDMPAAELFADHPVQLLRRLWRPLCLAALNVELEQASARIFLNVLRDSLGAEEPASRLLQPRVDLSALFPEAAVRWLLARGGNVRLHCMVRQVHPLPDQNACRVLLRDGTSMIGPVVLALPPERAAALLDGGQIALAATVAALRRLRSAPICTVYLRYEPKAALRQPLYALLDDPGCKHYGQWVFDRAAFDRAMEGILSVVISGSGSHLGLSRQALGHCVAQQLRQELGLPSPREHFTIIEKHATLIPSPDLQRPGSALPVAGLFLAGDAAKSPYPSTIEGSVRSGIEAARQLTRDAQQSKLPSQR
ncbi:MAG TPA: hydroxysqualene dehydroxylase HpnE [Burkholderiaceae bacterium]|nr:hydroxysqualene dehydroxylase HpnE [Burkholderiaceae bacterium]